MSDILTIACPDCGKPLKVRAELEGKKVRCKSCEHTFVVRAPAARKAAVAKKPTAPKPPPAKQKVRHEGEYDNPNPYDVTTLDLTPRCPHCAADFESEDTVICINCGYNTQTREHIRTERTIGNTGLDQFLWLLPGIACVLTICALIGLDIFWIFFFGGMVEGEGFPLETLASTPITLWVVIATLFGMYFAGKFAVKRLILNPVAPERRQSG